MAGRALLSLTMSSAQKRKKTWQTRALRLLRDALIFGGLIVLIFAWQRRGLLPADGQDAPDVTFKQLDGKSVKLSDYRGKRVQLHFWATWCRVCKMEHGALHSVFDKLGKDEVLLAVSGDADPQKVARYVKDKGLRYPVLIADRQALAAFNISSFPSNYFIDEKGKLRGRDVGMSSRWGMRWRLGCAAE